MVHGNAGEGEKQQINLITRKIHTGVHDMGTKFWWHSGMESLPKSQLFYVYEELEEQIKLSPIRNSRILKVALFGDRDKQLG